MPESCLHIARLSRREETGAAGAVADWARRTAPHPPCFTVWSMNQEEGGARSALTTSYTCPPPSISRHGSPLRGWEACRNRGAWLPTPPKAGPKRQGVGWYARGRGQAVSLPATHATAMKSNLASPLQRRWVWSWPKQPARLFASSATVTEISRA